MLVEREGDGGLRVVEEESGLVVAIGSGEGEGIECIVPLEWEAGSGGEDVAIGPLWGDEVEEEEEMQWTSSGKAHSSLSMLVTTARAEVFCVVYCPD